MFSVPLNCPATCELCGQWMPGHSVSIFIYFFPNDNVI